MALVVLGVVSGTLAGCGPSQDDIPVKMTRDIYASQQDCVQDWQAQDCTAQPASGPVATSSGGGHVVVTGPYRTARGQVYHVNGQVDTLGSTPRHGVGQSTTSISPSKAMSAGHAGESAVSRGGFGAHGGGEGGGHAGGGGHSGGG